MQPARRRARGLARRHRAHRHARPPPPASCVLILGFAFHWQATRAREADEIYETVRNAHRHRAQPRPLRPVGLGPRARPHLLVAFDVRDPRAASRATSSSASARSTRWSIPTTCNLYDARRRSSPTPRPRSIDHAFRMRHADGNWVWLRARCELVAAIRRDGAAPDRHRGRRHRAEDARRADRERRLAPARRHRDDLGGLRAVGRRQPAGAVQLEVPAAARPARRRDRGRHALRRRWSRPGASRSCARRSPSDDADAGRAHLRGAARRRPLAADQRAPHQGRRLRLGRHRHHHLKRARGEADRAASSG